MKPFLFLQIRPEYEAAENEYEAIISTAPAGVVLDRERICHVPVPRVDFSKYSGIILGGGPATVSDDISKKPDYQLEFEPGLFDLIRDIVDQDFPFMGICYGPGAIAYALGGVVSKKYGEKVGAYNIELTDNGKKDDLLANAPSAFKAFAGHKESVEKLPADAVVLATSETCPVQAYKIGNNVYNFQFHPELDAKGLEIRILAYKHLGYFKPEEATDLIKMGNSADVCVPRQILESFFKKYSYNYN